MLIFHTLIIRDANDQILDIVEIDPARPVTRGDVRAILATHKQARAIERITTTEQRPSS